MLRRATLLATLLAWVVAQVPMLVCAHGGPATLTPLMLADAHLAGGSHEHPHGHTHEHRCGEGRTACTGHGEDPHAPEGDGPHGGEHAVIVAELVQAGARADLPAPWRVAQHVTAALLDPATPLSALEVVHAGLLGGETSPLPDPHDVATAARLQL